MFVAVVVAGSALSAALPGGPASAANSTLTVNAAAPFRPVSRVAAGGLYALAENNRPADAMLIPIKMNTLTQPAPAGSAPTSGYVPATR